MTSVSIVIRSKENKKNINEEDFKMKRIVSFSIAVLIVLSLYGCGYSKNDIPISTETNDTDKSQDTIDLTGGEASDEILAGIAGSYVFSDVVSEDDAYIDESVYISLSSVTLELYEDGTGMMMQDGETVSVTWDDQTILGLTGDSGVSIRYEAGDGIITLIVDPGFHVLLQKASDLETSNSVIFGNVTFISDGSIELTPLEPYSAGSIWYSEPIDTRTGFNVRFSYWVGGGGNDGWDPSDGFTCSFSNHLGLGETGNLLGFYEEEGNYGVEFDTVPYPFGPNDPAFPHIAVIKGSTDNHLNYCAADYICDSEWHNVRICYKPSEGLTIYVDEDLKLSNPEVKLNNSVYVGFTAATGAGVDRHLIRDISTSVG